MSNNTIRNFSISINNCSILFLLIFLVFSSVFGFFALSKVDILKNKMHQKNKITAQYELTSAINLAIKEAEEVATNFSSWDETTQQIYNSTYFEYWLSNRVPSMNFVPHSYNNLQLYNVLGDPISDKHNIQFLRKILHNNIGPYFGAYSNNISLFYVLPIKSNIDINKITGFITIELDFHKLLQKTQKFHQLDYSTLKLNISDSQIMTPEQLMKSINYSVSSHPDFDSLNKLMIDNIWQFSGISLLLFILFSFTLYVLIGRPISHISQHLDALNLGKLKSIKSNPDNSYIVTELDKLRISLNGYILQLKDLEQVAMGNLSKINSTQYNKNSTGLMHTFNEVLMKLRETMEEKDAVSLQLNEQAKILRLVSEQASEANKAKSMCLANTSHEIRTPLTAIIGFAEISLDKNQTLAERIDATNTIIRCGKHLLQIINDILDLSKAEAKHLNIEMISISPFQIALEIETLVHNSAVKKGLNFTVEYNYPLPETITTDPFRLKQIILNVCNNAIKFTQAGDIILKLSYNLHEKNILFQVSDTGIGMTMEQKNIVFQPFSQANESISPLYGGTGLGLSFSKQLAILLGGDLTIESHIDVGSEITVQLPLEKLTNTKLVYNINGVTNNEYSHSKLQAVFQYNGNVLIAEDNYDTQRLMIIYLKRCGVNAVAVKNGLLAVRKAQTSHFDIIFMDIHMPVMDGIEATKTLRETGYDRPIIALTANILNSDHTRCIEAGVNDIVVKPIDRFQIYDILNLYLVKSDNNDQSNEPIISTIIKENPEFSNIINTFVTELFYELNLLQKAIDNNSWKEVKGILHDLTGISGNFGFPLLSQESSKLENSLDSGNYDDLKSQIKCLINIKNRMEAGLLHK